MHLILLYLTGLSPARIKLIRNYCLFLRFIFCIVFKVQCPPGGSPRESACVSYHHPKEKSTPFFTFFDDFFESFCFFEHSPQSIPPTFRFWARSYIIPRSVSFVILEETFAFELVNRTFHCRFRSEGILTYTPFSFIMRTFVLAVESTWLQKHPERRSNHDQNGAFEQLSYTRD